MKFLSIIFGFIFLLIISGCARQDVKPGETMFKEENLKFDADDSTVKIPFDIPQAEKIDQAKTGKK